MASAAARLVAFKPEAGAGGNNIIFGGRGNDIAFLGSGTNTFTWNPGDGNDTVEGQTGTNTLVFNGANIGEHIEISSNGGRVALPRDVASIIMDINAVQTLNVHALGGTDTITIDDLTATNLKKVNVDLGTTVGGADGAVDNVIVNGTASPDTIDITANSGVVSVAGLPAQVDVSHPEPANDVLTVNGLGGTDAVTIGAGVTSLIGVVVNQ